jgi:hypothetical protein
MYVIFGKWDKAKTYKEFVSTGMLAHYKKKFNDKK